MSDWKIQSINNNTHEVILINEFKEKFSCVVPSDQCFDKKIHDEYLKNIINVHELNKKKFNYKPYILYGALALETSYILIKLLMK